MEPAWGTGRPCHLGWTGASAARGAKLDRRGASKHARCHVPIALDGESPPPAGGCRPRTRLGRLRYHAVARRRLAAVSLRPVAVETCRPMAISTQPTDGELGTSDCASPRPLQKLAAYTDLSQPELLRETSAAWVSPDAWYDLYRSLAENSLVTVRVRQTSTCPWSLHSAGMLA